MTWVLAWATEGMDLFVSVGDASRRMKSWGERPRVSGGAYVAGRGTLSRAPKGVLV